MPFSQFYGFMDSNLSKLKDFVTGTLEIHNKVWYTDLELLKGTVSSTSKDPPCKYFFVFYV